MNAAIKHLREKCVKKRRFNVVKLVSATSPSFSLATSTALSSSVAAGTQHNGNGTTHKKVTTKKQRRDTENSGADDDDDGGGDNARPKDRVYNSDDEDDSDFEQHNNIYEMTKDRRGVFDFMNDAKPNEFQSVRSCSLKKIDVIMELRPFDDWSDLVQKIQNHKALSADLLNACQDFLARRNNMARIMKKCTRMVERLEAAVAVGGGLHRQPSNLNCMFKLADYQLIGLNWLVVMNAEEMNGILADEMGLGKTIQVIAFLAYLKEAALTRGTHLIVVPSSTLENWLQEFSR